MAERPEGRLHGQHTSFGSSSTSFSPRARTGPRRGARARIRAATATPSSLFRTACSISPDRAPPPLRGGQGLDPDVGHEGRLALEDGDVEKDPRPPARAVDAPLDEGGPGRGLDPLAALARRRERPPQARAPRSHKPRQPADQDGIDQDPDRREDPGREEEHGERRESHQDAEAQVGVQIRAGPRPDRDHQLGAAGHLDRAHRLGERCFRIVVEEGFGHLGFRRGEFIAGGPPARPES